MTRLTHGLRHTRVYGVWSQMKARCENPRNPAYRNYGERGIKVCDAWSDAAVFFADMGEPPEGFTLERIDNDKGYQPDNCCWASRADQTKNRRNVLVIEINGVSRPMFEVAEENGISRKTAWFRVQKGWDPVAAATFPVMRNRIGIKHGKHVYETSSAFGAQHGVAFRDEAYAPEPA